MNSITEPEQIYHLLYMTQAVIRSLFPRLALIEVFVEKI